MEAADSAGHLAVPGCNVAEWTGLEPATPGVTGRYSNRLNYHSDVGLAARRHGLMTSGIDDRAIERVVGAEGIEPPTYAL